MDENNKPDIAAKPMSFLWAWGIPMLIVISANSLSALLPRTAIVLLVFGAFVWMGLACVLNAKRCRRRHCYYSGPIFLLGAVVSILVGFEFIHLGQNGLNNVIGVTLLGALATYGSELIWGRYVK